MEAWRGTGAVGWRHPLSTKLSAGWPCCMGAEQSEGPEPRTGRGGSSDPMREAGVTSTLGKNRADITVRLCPPHRR
jgi:hypothetical protein